MQYFDYIRIFVSVSYLLKQKTDFMKKVVLKTIIILCTGVFAACGSSKKAMQVVALDGEWNIIAVNGDKIESATSPYLGFDMDENRLYGNAGCNRMTGSFEVDTLNPGKIHFGTIGTTRMMCPDMDVESRVLEALNTVKSYAETESGIELADAEGNAVLTLEKREIPAFAIDDLNGEWVIRFVNGVEIGEMENIPFIAFDVKQQRVHGNAGCNTINGGFSQEEGKANSLKFSQMISTLMACPNLETERQILGALNQVASFSFNEDETMSLFNEDGEELLKLEKNSDALLSK